MTPKGGDPGCRVSGVMQVVLSLNPGGTERLVIELARQAATVTRSVVCCLDEPGAWASELHADGIEVVSLHRQPGFHPSVGVRIAELASERGLNVLHCHQYSSFIYGRIAALRHPPLRIVYTEHGRLSDAPPSAKRRLVNPILSLFPGSIVAVSRDLRDYLVESGFPRRRVGVLFNGIQPGRPADATARGLVRQSLGLDTTKFTVGTVARLNPVKDLGLLLEAFGSLFRCHPEVALVIVGDGPDRRTLERNAQDLGCAAGVHFIGHRDDARQLLPALDVYVNCSITEGMSVTILEAMAAGLPVVATRVGGNPELVEDGVTGVLVPERSAAGLADGLRRLLASPREREGMGAAGRARLVAEFSLDRMVRQYFDAYGLTGSV